MQDLISLVVSLVVFGIMLLVGLLVGGTTERRHFQDLADREARIQLKRWTQSRKFINPLISTAPREFNRVQQDRLEDAGRQPPTRISVRPASIVMSEVTVASDYLKTFTAKLRNLVGGEVRSFESLMERARREAILRLVEQAEQGGYNALCNVRLDTVDIGGNIGKRGAAMVSIVATATAYHSVSAKA